MFNRIIYVNISNAFVLIWDLDFFMIYWPYYISKCDLKLVLKRENMTFLVMNNKLNLRIIYIYVYSNITYVYLSYHKRKH